MKEIIKWMAMVLLCLVIIVGDFVRIGHMTLTSQVVGIPVTLGCIVLLAWRINQYRNQKRNLY